MNPLIFSNYYRHCMVRRELHSALSMKGEDEGKRWQHRCFATALTTTWQVHRRVAHIEIKTLFKERIAPIEIKPKSGETCKDTKHVYEPRSIYFPDNVLVLTKIIVFKISFLSHFHQYLTHEPLFLDSFHLKS